MQREERRLAELRSKLDSTTSRVQTLRAAAGQQAAKLGKELLSADANPGSAVKAVLKREDELRECEHLATGYRTAIDLQQQIVQDTRARVHADAVVQVREVRRLVVEEVRQHLVAIAELNERLLALNARWGAAHAGYPLPTDLLEILRRVVE